MKKYIVCSLLIVLFACPLALAADLEAASVMTDQYLGFYHSGKPAKAYELYWNWDRFCARAFGVSYTKLNAAERKKVQELILYLSTSVFFNEDVVTAMKNARFTGQNIRIASDDSIQFKFETVFSDGNSGGPSTLYIEQNHNATKVIDMENRDGLLSRNLSAAYAPVQDKMSLISFLTETNNSATEKVTESDNKANNWLYGTWELTYDPDQHGKDYLTFKKFGIFIWRSARGNDYEGLYTVRSNKITLSLKVKNKTMDSELIVNDDKSGLTNKFGAHYKMVFSGGGK